VGNSNFTPEEERISIARYIQSGKIRADYRIESVEKLLVIHVVEKLKVVAAMLHCIQGEVFKEILGQVHVVFDIIKAISGSIIQNSARCRGVLEFSALKVGPKVYISDRARAPSSPSSCPETVKLVSFPKKSSR
jgi:hypothetical protein